MIEEKEKKTSAKSAAKARKKVKQERVKTLLLGCVELVKETIKGVIDEEKRVSELDKNSGLDLLLLAYTFFILKTNEEVKKHLVSVGRHNDEYLNVKIRSGRFHANDLADLLKPFGFSLHSKTETGANKFILVMQVDEPIKVEDEHFLKIAESKPFTIPAHHIVVLHCSWLKKKLNVHRFKEHLEVSKTKMINEVKQTPQRLARGLDTIINYGSEKLFQKIKIGFEVEGLFCIPFDGESYHNVIDSDEPVEITDAIKHFNETNADPLAKKAILDFMDGAKKTLKTYKRLKDDYDSYLENQSDENGEYIIDSIHELELVLENYFVSNEDNLKKAWKAIDKNQKEQFLEVMMTSKLIKKITEFIDKNHMADSYDIDDKFPEIVEEILNKTESIINENSVFKFYKNRPKDNITEDNFHDRGMESIIKYKDVDQFPELFYRYFSQLITKNVGDIGPIHYSNLYHGKKKESGWRVEYDSSLTDDAVRILKANKNYYMVVPVEIITPPMVLDNKDIFNTTAFKQFENLINFLNTSDGNTPLFKTTRGTGLHFNISIDRINTQINWLMFFSYLENGESGILKLFDREHNEYTESQLSWLPTTDLVNVKDGVSIALYSKTEHAMPANLIVNKTSRYKSGSLNKVYGKGHLDMANNPVEIRGMGNTNYHLTDNFQKIKLTIQKVVFSLLLSSNYKDVLDALGINKLELERHQAKTLAKTIEHVPTTKEGLSFFNLTDTKNNKGIRKYFIEIINILKINFVGNRFEDVSKISGSPLLEFLNKDDISEKDISIYLEKPMDKLYGALNELAASLKYCQEEKNNVESDIQKITYYLGPTFKAIVKKKLEGVDATSVFNKLPKELKETITNGDEAEHPIKIFISPEYGTFKTYIERIGSYLDSIEKSIKRLNQK